ncbi:MULTISPECIES: TIGR02678 family protein [unclassified Caldicellulosiruptor]|uniref:TIGR02678 family protein n=1 Tax=unclassified Caldicellulosiruptor TaxID=2622462 RepID=UPI0003AB19D5|nr:MULTISPECIES: TIGR02678 family protein [unclassified Caldicellulosiruptor]
MGDLLKLLENFWILKEEDSETFYRLKNLDKETREFIAKNLGLKFITTSNMVKLEKVPLMPKECMGVLDFEQPRDYAFLCLVLAFLEDKGPEDQFLLSNITEYIRMNFPDEEIDWTLYSNRRSLIRVLKFCEKMRMIRIDDGNQEEFAENSEAEVLYESTGISRYFMRIFPKSITEYSSWQEILNSEFEFTNGISQPISDIKRIRAYRGLVVDGSVNFENEDELLYIKRQKVNITSELEKHLPEASFHIFKSFAFLAISENYKNTYPDDSNLCDILLLVASMLLSKIEKGEYSLHPTNETLEIHVTSLKSILEDVQKQYKNFWNKEWREKSLEKVFDEFLKFLYELGFAKLQEDGFVVIYPIYLKVVGEYQVLDEAEESI